MPELTYRQAVAAALAQEMARDERVVLLGEDIASGGVFKTTLGLAERFGKKRVRNTPISETAIAGAAMGAAMAGLRPVAEIMFSDFYGVCWDQVAVEIAKARYMTGGQFGLPLVIRGANGGGIGFGAQHSQSVENWALCVPGLKIVSPATPADAVGLIAAAIRDDDPVLVFEHKALYGSKGDVPDGEHVLPLGEAAVLREGDDVTLVGLSLTVGMCLAAADRLAEAGISAEVIDLRTLVPLDTATVLRAVRRTGHVVIAEENPGQLGWGAAIAAILAEEAFEDLDGPVLRVSGGNIPLPVAAPLEAEVSVSTDRIVAAVGRLLGLRACAGDPLTGGVLGGATPAAVRFRHTRGRVRRTAAPTARPPGRPPGGALVAAARPHHGASCWSSRSSWPSRSAGRAGSRSPPSRRPCSAWPTCSSCRSCSTASTGGRSPTRPSTRCRAGWCASGGSRRSRACRPSTPSTARCSSC